MKPLNEAVIDFHQIQDIVYWSMKWAISPHQLLKAFYAINTASVAKLEEYLRSEGFAV
ncbi:MAG: hypothetical protein WKF97_24360 [Chitinophagaceae bacterium]